MRQRFDKKKRLKMDKNSQKTLGNRDGRKLEPGRYLNLREKTVNWNL